MVPCEMHCSRIASRAPRSPTTPRWSSIVSTAVEAGDTRSRSRSICSGLTVDPPRDGCTGPFAAQKHTARDRGANREFLSPSRDVGAVHLSDGPGRPDREPPSWSPEGNRGERPIDCIQGRLRVPSKGACAYHPRALARTIQGRLRVPSKGACAYHQERRTGAGIRWVVEVDGIPQRYRYDGGRAS